MAKKKKINFLFFNSYPKSLLCVGVAIGIATQRIPQVKAYTDEMINPIEERITQNFTQENSLPGQPTASFVIHRSNYSLAYDARNRNPAWVF